MYASPITSPFARPRAMAGMYSRVGVETGVEAASTHRLVAMLFDGYMESLAQARGALLSRDIAAKGRAIGRAAAIVEEGLKAGLNLDGGGALAADLRDLYTYVAMRLTQANLRNDAAALDECQRLMQPLRDAWASIGGSIESRPAA